MKAFESLFPRFICPKCGWQLSVVDSGADVLPGTAAFVLLLLAGVFMPTAWQIVIVLLWLAAVLLGRRVVVYRCPVCGRQRSDRDLAEGAGESRLD
jgi:predicted RNA-binding Zn-ribbon protein involved in translation (DUF1610 family)